VAALDIAFQSHAAITLAHILPALGFVLFALFCFCATIQARGVARAADVPLGLAVGGTVTP
jgi:hypothetical protein